MDRGGGVAGPAKRVLVTQELNQNHIKMTEAFCSCYIVVFFSPLNKALLRSEDWLGIRTFCMEHFSLSYIHCVKWSTVLLQHVPCE